MSVKQKRRIKYAALILTPACLIVLLALVSALYSDSSAVAQYTVPPEYQTCTECHDNSTLITGKETAWETSLHGTGEAYLRGTSKSCAGCHSGGGFSNMIDAGLEPNSSAMVGDASPTRQTCRACHQVHETYTGGDWALETTAPVSLYVLPGTTFDGGEGNLCAKCHQPRTKAPAVAPGGTVSGISSHWGPHHGPQSSMMLGTDGAGQEGTPSAHYTAVQDTCVTCHMGSNDNHTYTPEVATCKSCHTTATNFDINGVQTTVQAKSDQLKSLLVNAGALSCTVDEEGVEECAPSVTSAPDNIAYALWNWTYIVKEDKSKGVHNADYTNALLDASIAGITCDATPVLGLGQPQAFWGSYADYQAGVLSVTYAINNGGGTTAFNVMLTNSSTNNGVTVASSLPASVGNIAGGASAPVTVQYNIPSGVSWFNTANGATAQDNCGNTFTFGSQPA